MTGKSKVLHFTKIRKLRCLNEKVKGKFELIHFTGKYSQDKLDNKKLGKFTDDWKILCQNKSIDEIHGV